MNSLIKRLELRHLRMVRAIAQCHGVSAAAKQLHLTQSALSHQLKVLEDAIEARMFLRQGKKLLLTDMGRRVLVTAEAVERELINMSTDLSAIALGAQARIRLATECYTSFHWLPKVIPQFKLSYPQVEVTLNPVVSPIVTDRLLDGTADLVIKMLPASDGFLNFPLFADELMVVMAPNHALSKFDEVSVEQLIQQTIIMCPYSKEKLHKGIEAYVQNASLNVVELPLTEAILEWCSAGLGVAVMASWAAQPSIDRGEVVVKPLGVTWAKRQWHAVCLKGGEKSVYEAFLRTLKDCAPANATVV